MIRFNKPYITGRELEYIKDVVKNGRLAGNGKFTKLCQQFFERKYGFKKTLLTTSCTDAMEMAAILLDIKAGDEVIAPSYTFVSTANAFVLRGAKIVFADCEPNFPNISANEIEKLITEKTKAIVLVHYGGVACEMSSISSIVKNHDLYLVEDAAQSINSFYNGEPLGSFGDLSAFSFHETKNIVSGEGGMIAINNPKFIERAEVVWEKGTNRSAFFRGEVEKYNWMDIGSSFLPSEINAAFLFAQLEALEKIEKKRKTIWNYYQEQLLPLKNSGHIEIPEIPDHKTNNAHLFYLLTKNLNERNRLLEFLKENEINAVFHYLSLHASPYYQKFRDNREFPNSMNFEERLIRLPLYPDLKSEEMAHIVRSVFKFYEK